MHLIAQKYKLLMQSGNQVSMIIRYDLSVFSYSPH